MNPVDELEPDPRPMTPHEETLVNAFLAFDFLGVEELRVQCRSLLVTPGCTCGCGTLNLHPVGNGLRPSAAARPVEIIGSSVCDRRAVLCSN